MKKKITIALLLFIASTSLFAQSTTKFRFGIGGNIGGAWLKSTTKGLERKDIVPALGYGLMFDYNLSDNYAISTGLEVNYRGGGFHYDKDSISSGLSNTKVNLQYLEIPLMLKMKTKAIGYFTYFTSFGGSVGYRLSSTGDYYLTDNHKVSPVIKSVSKTDENIDAQTNLVAISFIVNLGAEYNISGKTSLYGALFFNNCFMDVLTDPDEVNKSNPDVELNARANVLGLKLGIFF